MDDLGLFNLETSKDLYGKLLYDYEKLKDEESTYNYFNFIIVAFHLYDWIKSDESIGENEKKIILKKLKDNNIDLFRDLANRAKHFKLKRERETITKDEFIQGFSYSTFSYNRLNCGGNIYLVEQDGEEINLFYKCTKILNIYTEIFEI